MRFKLFGEEKIKRDASDKFISAGNIFLKLGAITFAIVSFQKSFELGNQDAGVFLAFCLSLEEKMKEAKEILSKINVNELSEPGKKIYDKIFKQFLEQSL